jgi:hypothetical protein
MLTPQNTGLIQDLCWSRWITVVGLCLVILGFGVLAVAVPLTVPDRTSLVVLLQLFVAGVRWRRGDLPERDAGVVRRTPADGVVRRAIAATFLCSILFMLAALAVALVEQRSRGTGRPHLRHDNRREQTAVGSSS